MAASAVEAGDNFFNTDSTATGTVANNQASPPAPITGATALSGTARKRLPGLGRIAVYGGPDHHRQRHDAHLRQCRCYRQPAQRHRQRPDAAEQDRPDHGHVDPIDHRRRRHHDPHRQCLDPVDHEQQPYRVRRPRLRRHSHGDAAAAAGQRLAIELCNRAGEWIRQYGRLVHRQFRAGFAALDLDGADRRIAIRPVRRPGQRAGDPPAAAADRGLCRRDGAADRDQFGRGDLRAQRARRGEPDAASRTADDSGHPDRLRQRADAP